MIPGARSVCEELRKLISLPPAITRITIDMPHDDLARMTVHSIVKVDSVSDFANVLAGCEVRHKVGVSDGQTTVNFDIGEEHYK